MGVASTERDEVGQGPEVERLVLRRLDAEHLQQRSRGVVGIDAGILEQLMNGDVEDASRVISALDVATDPVKRFRVAGQH